MQILVIGTGYVGLVVGACLAETGNDVVCADIDAQKIADLQNNILPIYEPGLEELVRRNQEQGRLRFSTDSATAAATAEVVFLAVGTPPGEDGSADLRHVLAAAETVGKNLRRETVVITKSTVPVGTAKKVSDCLARHARVPFHVCSNPEFLKEGAAVEDFMRPDRVVLGVETDFARSVLAELYAPFVRTGKPILFMDIASAELTKYAANAMLATRISFMNELALLCERVGADVDNVRRGVGSDARIGSSFLFPGPGYGGSCFPKDVKALLATAGDNDVPLRVVAAVHQANERQKHVMYDRLVAALDGDVKGTRVAVWGLAFKPQTDDMRESPALTLIEALLAAGADVVAHDPVAMTHAQKVLGDRITYAATSYDAVEGADALAVVTDWNEYRHPDFERVRGALARPIVVDGRNLYQPRKMEALGFEYHSIGRPLGGRPAAQTVA
ncbi:nucleotide sugar dehydrogenase [Gemmatirosa kalamazoonensis]|uniref:UDP-glucose 6-dehydrogenase n=1 Tax=Gemmatirosa kalamazoonensis TaxID=861299 RepID=W0RA80_9BACT|nr:UDP-glucose/GDP-mannose dehydrogenase family protein [Gemmatirosa kalamazoonensis]AHG87681.1 nucleotide sugar dehydrogenase [Gemmatirosa kalamazoonensis]